MYATLEENFVMNLFFKKNNNLMTIRKVYEIQTLTSIYNMIFLPVKFKETIL
jgi:hypothetical protein